MANPVGSSDVYFDPEPNWAPYELTVGDDKMLECHLHVPRGENYTIIWFKDGHKLKDSERFVSVSS